MFRIETETALLNAFRPRDRKHVEVPQDFHFPRFVRDYVAWSDPYNTRTFVVFTDPNSGRPLGIVFRRDQQPGGASTSHMCDWCHSTGSSMEIGLLTAEASSKRRVGVNLCLDLRCSEKLETAANLAGKNPRTLIRQMVERMEKFAHDGLGIDFVAAA